VIRLDQWAAVFSRPVPTLAGLSRTVVDPQPPRERMDSACAAYAIAAMSQLEFDPGEAALVCLSGPTGATVKAFDKAWQASPDGLLTGEGFGASRYKRVHPFTLIKCMQNQTPAMLSMRFGLQGPCLNAIESASAFAYLLPNVRAMLARRATVLLVMASAGFREEERAKQRLFIDEDQALEGAVCLAIRKDGRLGAIEAAAAPATAAAPVPADPPLEAGVRILECLAEKRRERLIPLRDRSGHTAWIRWRVC